MTRRAADISAERAVLGARLVAVEEMHRAAVHEGRQAEAFALLIEVAEIAYRGQELLDEVLALLVDPDPSE